jgi:GTP pyrophosphokinase/guanosine-3',5'-bis(diphosphate) 3'-pyrophosphohydrolase
MNKIIEATNYCIQKHAGTFRRGSGEAYSTHPIAVSKIVIGHKVSKKLDDLVIAALLHDTLEDTDTTFSEIASLFGPLVASLVLELTNDSAIIADMGKLAYHKKKLVGMSSYALVIKLADRLHNISDGPSKKMKSETIDLMAHLKANRTLSSTHSTLVEKILNLSGVA